MTPMASMSMDSDRESCWVIEGKEGQLRTKRSNSIGILMFLSLVTTLSAAAGYAQTRTAAELAFQRLQSLAGEWEGKDEHGMAARTVFQSSVSRTVVMETLSCSSGMPSMMTLYSLDGNGIALVHYCPTNNQPRMKAIPGGGALAELVFSFTGAGNLATPETGHEHKLVMRFEDNDHISETWTWHENGKDHDQVFHFSRKTRHSGSSPGSKQPLGRH